MNEHDNQYNQTEHNSAEPQTQQPTVPPTEQPVYPPQQVYQQPMYGRSAGGQYNAPQYQQPQYGYYAPVTEAAPAKPFVDQRAGSPFFDKKGFAEKQSVRRIGNSVGFSLSMFAFFGTVIQLLLLAVMYLTVGVGDTTALMSDPNMLYIINAVTTLVVLTVPYVFAAKFADSHVRELLPFEKVSFIKVVTFIMLGMGVCAVSNYATGMLSNVFEQFFGIEVESSMSDYGTGWDSFLLMLLCIGVLPAILEEFALRGVVMGLLRKRFSDGASIFISALLFGLLHGNLQQIPFAFGVGLILGYATVYTKSLVPAMLIHAMNNSLSVVLSFATASASPMMSQVTMLLYYAVSLLLGACGFIILIKTDKSALRLSRERTENTKRYTRWFFGSAWIIVFLVIIGLEVLASLGLSVAL